MKQRARGPGQGRDRGTKNAPRQCPFCDMTFGQDRGLVTHLSKTHDDNRPLSEIYVTAIMDGVWPVCACGCNTRLEFNKWNTPFASVILGHNAAKTAMVAAHGTDWADDVIARRKSALRGKEGWSHGLSKDTDERIARRAVRQRQGLTDYYSVHEHWSKGKRKDTDERIARRAQKARDDFASGKRTPWMKGLTKETDARVAKLAASVKKSMSDPTLQARLSELKKLKPEVIMGRLTIAAPDFELLSTLVDYKSSMAPLQFRCRRCNYTQERSINSVLGGQCYGCGIFGSAGQNEVTNFIKSLGFKPRVNDREYIKPLELDIYVDERKFAVEFNGLFYHSEYCNKDKHRHSIKTKLCMLQGITLFHLFEDEWRDKRPIVESMIRHRLGKSSSRVGARQCKLVTINHKERCTFFERNHIAGDTKASVALGLIAPNGELVACLSIRRPKHRKYRNMFEVARFCSVLNTTINGALSRLSKAAANWCNENGGTQLITYVDERHGTGESYAQAGWQYVEHTAGESFWWTDFEHRFDRFTIKADKARKLQENEVALERGMTRVWGCKNKRFVYRP